MFPTEIPKVWLPLAFAYCALIVTPSYAQENAALIPAAEAQAAVTELESIEKGVAEGVRDETVLSAHVDQVNAIKAGADACIESAQQKLGAVRRDLETLGPSVEGEERAVTQKRIAMAGEQSSLEKQLSSCRLLVLRSKEVLEAVEDVRKVILAQRLLARGPPLISLLEDNWQHSSEWFRSTREFIAEHSGIRSISAAEWSLVALAALVTDGWGLMLRRGIRRQFSARKPVGFAGAFRRAFASVLASHGPRLFVSSTIAVLVWIFSQDLETMPFVGLVAYGLPVYFLLAALIQLFLAPPAPAAIFLPIDPNNARKMARRLKVLAFLLYLGYLLLSTVVWQSLPAPALLLARGVLAAVLVVNLISIVWLFRRITGIEELNWLRATVSLLLISALGAEWLGYRNLSAYLVQGVTGTMLAVGLGLLLSRIFREFYEGLEHGRRGGYRKLRGLVGLEPGTPFPALTWLRFITTSVLWTGIVALALGVWGFAREVWLYTYEFLLNGFSVGSLKILPSRILLALLILLLLVPTGRWLRSRLEKRWLAKTYMERGAREALVTLSGYAVIAVAVLLALGVAGMDFGKLAIIAGALSVGIGFGLQNIVNNFVSGLILLFERPIKKGDWIVVGTTEGYVRQISFRATQIQTFDRADVIVPNSELVSNQVTNWMLRDAAGRVVVPLSVARGSDTETVRELLLKTAKLHPEVVSGDNRLPDPVVLFRRFGESALEFELRCFVRDVDSRLAVTSELNFAIDRAFRENGIEVPFPQRVLHVRPSQDVDALTNGHR